MTSIIIFIIGAILLIFAAEKLIDYLIGVASGLRVSVFFLAIIFTGIEFDDIILGVVLNVENLDGVALGIVIGTALSMVGVVLALAALIAPSRINIPRDYIILFAAAPFVLIPVMMTQPLTWVHGIVLILLFLAFLAYVTVREFSANRPVFRDAEMYDSYAAARAAGGSGSTGLLTRPENRADTGLGGSGPSDSTGATASANPSGHIGDKIPFMNVYRKSGWKDLILALLALAVLILGATMVGEGTEGILEATGMAETVFGATIATAVLTVEDIFLTVRPALKHAPEIGIANVIGSEIFSVTGKLGIILLFGSIVVDSSVVTWHIPALIVMTLIAAYFISTGWLRRWHGVVLLSLYVIYWIVSYTVFGIAPVDPD